MLKATIALGPVLLRKIEAAAREKEEIEALLMREPLQAEQHANRYMQVTAELAAFGEQVLKMAKAMQSGAVVGRLH
ncbi:hypothetical protein [uncultured Microbulbifer sp.]|uniref:hypothetical protein n=1 Tax=uncultured Microbulbifer sp. TaxID=348147 RepID=UPI0026266DE2|nr:hypothetical protein [uncultured Microbulbifer sp.]